MKLPESPLPFMTGAGPFGSVEMGGMFIVTKVRPDIAATDYRDPGWYKQPAGTLATEWTGEPPAAASRAPADGVPRKRTDYYVVDPRTRRVRIADHEQ